MPASVLKPRKYRKLLIMKPDGSGTNDPLIDKLPILPTLVAGAATAASIPDNTSFADIRPTADGQEFKLPLAATHAANNKPRELIVSNPTDFTATISVGGTDHFSQNTTASSAVSLSLGGDRTASFLSTTVDGGTDIWYVI